MIWDADMKLRYIYIYYCTNMMVVLLALFWVVILSSSIYIIGMSWPTLVRSVEILYYVIGSEKRGNFALNTKF